MSEKCSSGSQGCRRLLRRRRGCPCLSFEQFGMGADPGKIDGTARPVRVGEAIDQEEITTDVAFPVARPRASERVIPPFGTERRLIGDEKEHDRLQPIHIVSAGTREPLPVLEELSGVVNPARQVGPFTGRWLLQVPQTSRPRSRIAPCASSPSRPPRPWPCGFARSAP